MVRQKIDFSGLVGSFLEYWCTLTLKPGEAFGFFFFQNLKNGLAETMNLVKATFLCLYAVMRTSVANS